MQDFGLLTVKKLSSIVFLVILLFNFWGYRFMINCLQDQQDASLALKLDAKQYSDADLISIKTPLNLPYYSSSSTFERTYGSIDVNGITYEYVKSRVYNDTLELLCLPNKAKAELQSVKNQFFKFSIDVQGTPHNKKAPNIIKPGLPDFVQDFTIQFGNNNSDTEKEYFHSNTSHMMPGFLSRQERPPQSMPFFV